MRINSESASLRTLLLEAAVVAVAGFGLALLANQVSPRGLVLTRDYFGDTTRETAPDAKGASRTDPTSAAGKAGAVEPGPSRDGVRALGLDEALRLHADPRREQGLTVFVDARAERFFREGHIPGAVPFDHFYPEKNFAEVLAACSLAEQVVIYCNGGDCADSHLAARLLRDAGVPVERLAVFTGGIGDWKARGSRIETGDRNSGDLRNP